MQSRGFETLRDLTIRYRRMVIIYPRTITHKKKKCVSRDSEKKKSERRVRPSNNQTDLVFQTSRLLSPFFLSLFPTPFPQPYPNPPLPILPMHAPTPLECIMNVPQCLLQPVTSPSSQAAGGARVGGTTGSRRNRI